MLASRGKNLAVRTSAALITEERSDVGPTSLARTDSHHALVAVRETVAGTNRQVHHRTDSARTSSATPADWPAGLSVGLTDLTHGTLDASTRVCNTVSADSIVTKASGLAEATEGINSKVDVCVRSETPHETLLVKLYKFIFVTALAQRNCTAYNNSDEVANLADRLVRPTPTITTF